MKRVLLATVVSIIGVPGAWAQSSVEFYGRMNLTLERLKVGSNSSDTLIRDNLSRVGLTGREDLGNGFAAVFAMEHQFSADTGVAAAQFWGRESNVGLASPWGTLRLGNMKASEAYFAIADYVSLHNHDTGTSEDAFYRIPASYNLKNAVWYGSPTFAGFRADIQYSLREQPGDTQARAGAVNYDNGPVHLGLAFEANSFEQKVVAFRALYEMGSFVWAGYIGHDSGSGFGKRNFGRVAGMYTKGPSEFHVNVGYSGKLDGAANSNAKQWTLAYNYNFSKRTKVHAFYTKVDNGSASSYVVGNYGGTTGDDLSSVGVGIRHSF